MSLSRRGFLAASALTAAAPAVPVRAEPQWRRMNGAWAAELTAFRRDRIRYLLYR